MENNNGFTLKEVIFNLLFIILFVFILLWLFPSKSFLNSNGIYNSENEQAQTNHIFNQNITVMKEAAISYFTTSRLPKNVGDSVTMTLRQMRDKKLLLSLIDSNGNVCDEGISYIEMTKEKDEYLLKVTLSCSDFDDYILVHLGCYDYCDGDICEKKEEILYKYQYKLVIPCKWTDWSAWSNWSYNYVTANANRKVETKVETETINATKICPAGYLYNSQTNKCYKSTSSTDSKEAEKITSYECAEGFTFDETDKKCKKTATTTTTVAAKEKEATYNCNAYPGHTLNGNRCVKTVTSTETDTKSATPVYDYKCSKGTLSSDKTKCTYTNPYEGTMNATCNSYQSCTTTSVFNATTGKFEDKRTCVTKCRYTCPSGFTREGSRCSGTFYETKTIASTRYIKSYTCPSGYEKNGNYCTKNISVTTTDSKTASKNPTEYYCENSNYTLVGNVCKLEQTIVIPEDSKVVETYSCAKYNDSAYVLNGTKCEKIISNTETTDLIPSCPSGYTLNNNKCSRNVIKYRYSERSCVGGSIDYKWSDSEKDEALLNKGYILTGVKEKRNSK